MESLIHDLIQVLERQKGLLQEMLAAARHHNLALRQNDLALLKDAISQEEELSTQLKAGELQQGQIQMALLREKLNLPADAPWSTMVAGLPEEF
ncbi:MAG: flagellar export chaperone FlgN [Pelotomaculum sp.]